MAEHLKDRWRDVFDVDRRDKREGQLGKQLAIE
jgi:hypothetical protein